VYITIALIQVCDIEEYLLKGFKNRTEVLKMLITNVSSASLAFCFLNDGSYVMTYME